MYVYHHTYISTLHHTYTSTYHSSSCNCRRTPNRSPIRTTRSPGCTSTTTANAKTSCPVCLCLVFGFGRGGLAFCVFWCCGGWGDFVRDAARAEVVGLVGGVWGGWWLVGWLKRGAIRNNRRNCHFEKNTMPHGRCSKLEHRCSPLRHSKFEVSYSIE